MHPKTRPIPLPTKRTDLRLTLDSLTAAYLSSGHTIARVKPSNKR